jgi:hypothetical protein
MERHPKADNAGRRFTSPVVMLSALLVITLVAWLSIEYLRDRLAGSGSPQRTRQCTPSGSNAQGAEGEGPSGRPAP